jgi:hypothetical protein
MELDKYLKLYDELYSKINQINNSKIPDSDKWQEIASVVHSNSHTIRELYYILKKIPRKDIKLDYNLDPKQLAKQIETEQNAIVKVSLLITALHHITYDMMSKEGNYYLKFDGKKEIHVLKKDIYYYTHISIKNEQNIYFHAFILQYALESLFDKHFYVGIDFEYTNKKIQLAQLNFEHNVALQSMIMIVSPSELEKVMSDDFVDLIICNKYIKKILHGSDSLDIPYMYEHLLENDPIKIRRFTRTMIDTRFLCEFYKANQNEPSDNKCRIYDEDKTNSTIFYFGVINEQKQTELTEMLDSMPPVHDIKWNIHKMPESQVIYALNDVIFLKYFYYRMIYVATLHENTIEAKKATIQLYKHVLFELTQFTYLESRGITFLTNKCKEEVDPMNNFMIRKPTQIIKLVDIFNSLSEGLIIRDPKVNLDSIKKINHYKTKINILLKKIIYTSLSKKCRIHKDKLTIFSDKLSNEYIFEFFKKMNYFHLEKIFREVENIVLSKIDFC